MKKALVLAAAVAAFASPTLAQSNLEGTLSTQATETATTGTVVGGVTTTTALAIGAGILIVGAAIAAGGGDGGSGSGSTTTTPGT